MSKAGILTIPAYFLARPNLSNFTPLMSDDYGYPKNGLFSCPHFCFRYIFIHSNQYGIDRDYLSDSGWVLTISTHFLGNFGPTLANYTPQITTKPLKLVYYHALTSVSGICINSTQYGILEAQGWILTISAFLVLFWA